MSFNIIDSNLNVLDFKKDISVYNIYAGEITVRTGANGYTIQQETTIAELNGITFYSSPDTTYDILPNTEQIITILAGGTPSNLGSFFMPLEMENGENNLGLTVSFSVSNPVPAGCERYIAIVVDESGSINEEEVFQIRNGLTSFVNSQSLTNTRLSLIGMSNSDTNLRSDHVLEKKVAENQQLLLDWISYFGSRPIDAQSDYWASGLEVVNDLTVTPDIIIIVTDGMQVNNTGVLQNLYSTLNQKSHVFVYGVTGNDLSTTIQAELVSPLNFYLGRTPLLKSNSGLDTDYIRYSDFSNLGFELSQLTADLTSQQIGCVAKVKIIENNLSYPVLTTETPVNQQAGSLVLENKSRVDLTLLAGTRIHNTETVNGLVFKLENTVTITALSQLEVSILIEGTPVFNGHFTEVIVLDQVDNPNNFNINLDVQVKPVVEVLATASLQSSSLQIIAAGSKGVDSTRGIHLRWLLAGELGTKHLPKGDLFTGTNFNFNKQDDFVKVYRSPYVKIKNESNTLSLSQAPDLVDSGKALWIYKMNNGNRVFYVHFKNKKKYNYVSNLIRPSENPTLFIHAYGDNLIEIENQKELFFAVELNFSSVNSSSIFRLETLSVAKNTILASKKVSTRKTYTSSKLDAVRVLVENGRSIRFKASNCNLDEINFEFYSDFIKYSNDTQAWDLKGKYALSLEDTIVFKQLEPKFNAVHGKWLKYNDGEYVNTRNYRDKWNKITDVDDKNLKEAVETYIELSNNPSLNNPTALETISFGDAVQIENEEGETEIISNTTEISNLDLLNIAANDYHIARMLGLGCLDIDNTVFTGDFVYLAEYTSFGDLQDGLGAREVQHLSMSIPVSIEKQRFPLPVHLNKIEPGLNIDSTGNESANITDKDGYSHDGRKRYVSLFMEDIMDYGSNTPFFESSLEYEGSSFTFPIYVGVDYKIDLDTNWVKPELASDLDYRNVNKDLELSMNEPVPIIIPESDKSFLNVRQEQIGEHKYIYQGYGINIFSRAASGKQISIHSDIRPANTLIPPTGINSLLITPENPLVFTSAVEQNRLETIGTGDKTYIRLLFEYYSAHELQTEYHTAHELQNYSIPEGMSLEDALKGEKAIDKEEILANYFEVFFRDSLPQIEYAKIVEIDNNTESDITSVIRVKGYTVSSSGEKIELTITEASKERFIGGVLTIEDQNYIIKGIEINYLTIDTVTVLESVDVEVVNKEIVSSILADGDATVNSEQIKAIVIPENRLCMLVENMLTSSNWNPLGQPLDFKIEYPTNLGALHREIIGQKDDDGNEEYHIEKTRGIWEDALIERFEEVVYETNENGVEVASSETKHLGLYKITFPGFKLPQHSQYKEENIENSVEWFNGIVRLFTKNSLESGNSIHVNPRKEFKVFRADNIGTTNDLVLYISDPNFKLQDNGSLLMDPNYDEIIVGNQTVNYYPSYKAYLFADSAYGLTEKNILPEGESIHYSIFGIRTHGKTNPDNPVNSINYDSKISVPSPMHAVRVEKLNPPDKPKGSLYATRPDFFKRSTYTLTTEYKQKPHGVLYYRANDEVLLSVLYEQNTILQIREELNKRGGNNEISSNSRWANFLNFEELQETGTYASFQDLENTEESYSFPIPDNEDFIAAINEFINWHNETNLPEGVIPAKIIDNSNPLLALNQVIIPIEKGIVEDLLAIYFIEQVIHSVFVPLTEIPVIYDLIEINRSLNYVPSAKKQTIKDKDGHILKASDPAFDMAPMMKIVPPVESAEPTEQNATAVQFTDFNIDGTSNNLYFYGVREMDAKMNFGSFSPFLGPVKLVNSNPPQAPEIKRIMPVLENPVLGINPAIQIELNAYHQQHNIKKISVYRASTMFNAQSIRTMNLVKEIVVDESILATDFDNVWQIYDEFEDVENIPFGEGLFYRITVSREIEYEEYDFDTQVYAKVIDYTPSQPSKITATIISDNISPESAVLQASGVLAGIDESILQSVVLHWEKTVHNGKYHLYKMNSQGNWEKIHEIISNEYENQLSLEQTLLASDSLAIKTEDGDKIYHHFKLIAENASGMYSSEEKILSLYNENLIVI